MNTEIKRKKRKVVILPTEKTSEIWSNKGRQLYFNQNNPNDPDDEIRYHLYIVDEEAEIKEGDYLFNTSTELVFSADKSELEIYNHYSHIVKVIVSTDKSLGIHIEGFHDTRLPQPSPGFVRAYIKAYNDKNIIEYVDVEYELFGKVINPKLIYFNEILRVDSVYMKKQSHSPELDRNLRCSLIGTKFEEKYKSKDTVLWENELELFIKLKTDKNNCITIHKIKDSFTRKEMENAFDSGIGLVVLTQPSLSSHQLEEIKKLSNEWKSKHL